MPKDSMINLFACIKVFSRHPSLHSTVLSLVSSTGIKECLQLLVVERSSARAGGNPNWAETICVQASLVLFAAENSLPAQRYSHTNAGPLSSFVIGELSI